MRRSLRSCSEWLLNACRRRKELKARTVWLGCPEKCEEKYPKNTIKNQKYNIFTFIPGVRLPAAAAQTALLFGPCPALLFPPALPLSSAPLPPTSAGGFGSVWGSSPSCCPGSLPAAWAGCLQSQQCSSPVGCAGGLGAGFSHFLLVALFLVSPLLGFV